MYRYDEFDAAFVQERTAQFRKQVERRLKGELSEDEFKPLRLMNGLYLQLHAYMLRVAIPYGTFSSKQMRKLADIARRYDKGYAHFTTRQNIQYNWPKLEDVPDILAELASVEMHAIQTSGNCIRNTTTDQYAGVACDEIEDPRIYAEIIRQWSTLHPEFSFLPRKFKIALTACSEDRAAVRFHDIGLIMKRADDGHVGFEVIAGGGLGRTPVIGKVVREFLPKEHLLSYLEAILRVYNMCGRRDNKYKARIKITLNETGIEKFRSMVEKEWLFLKDNPIDLPASEVERICSYFSPPPYEQGLPESLPREKKREKTDEDFDLWLTTNVVKHKYPGYAIVTFSLKPIGGIPGDVTAEQMDKIADMADEFSFGEIRSTHEQNLVLANVRQSDLKRVYGQAREIGLATPNLGKITDIICCPGLDYCALATARSIPVAQRISKHFADLKKQKDIGDLKLKISGCINACGHHHVGNIGILGLDRRGEEFYQITLGGSADEHSAIGKIIGPAFSYENVVEAIEKIIDTYLDLRHEKETFLQTYGRLGIEPFKTRLYGSPVS